MPYQIRPYDNSAHTGRMGDLIRARGQIEAQRGAASADAWAAAANQIGQTVSGTMRDMVEIQRQEPARRRAEAAATREERAARQQSNLDGVMQMAGTLPPDEAIDLLRREGFTKESGEMQRQLSQARRDAIADQKAQYELANTKLGSALDLLSSIDGKPQSERSAAYAAVAPRVRELVGADLAAMVPDTYDPAFMQSATEWGLTAREKITTRREALNALRTDLKDAREADEHFTKSLSTWLSTVDDQGEWTAALKNAQALGARPETLAKFGDTYSPEAVAKAVSFTKKDRPTPAAGSLEDYVRVLEHEKGRALDAGEIRRARQEYSAAGRAPSTAGTEKPGSVRDDLRAAEQWKARELSDLEEKYANNEIDERTLEAGKARIQESYLVQLGMPPQLTPPDQRRAGGMGDLVPSAPPQTPSAPFGATPAAAAPAPKASPAPPRVGDIRTVKGQQWRITRVYPDGSFDADEVK